MSQRVARHAPVLKMLSKSKPQSMKTMIKAADKDLINTLCECSLNVLKGVVPLTGSQKRKLVRHKQTMRTLARKSNTLQTKKALLQKGGFLGALLAPVLGFLGNLLLH